MRVIEAHGKVILFGEHAVVHGRTALALGLPGALVAASVEPTRGRVAIDCADWGLHADDSDDVPVGHALHVLSELVPGTGGCSVRASASIPMGAGLGSSAAMAVLIVRCLSMARGVETDAERTREAVHEAERLFHGNPSGMDGAVATHGGWCLFRRSTLTTGLPRGIRHEVVAPNLVRPDLPVPSLVVGNTGVPRPTARMVAVVGRRMEDDRPAVEAAFDEIEACLGEGLSALALWDMEALGRLMTRNHRVLRDLGLSCPEAEAMVTAALRSGARGAKITGAGGGGCVVALAPGREEAVVESWRRGGFEAWVAAGPVAAG